MRILIVEDEPDLLASLAQALREEGYAVDEAPDGEEGFYKAENYDYDAIVLDVMLPKLDGWEILKRLRQIKKTPVLMLTARDQLRDRVRGLDTGADDYLVKPFAFSELMARLQVIARRPAAAAPETVLRLRDIALDLRRREVTRAGRRIDLQPREVLMLEELMRNADKVMTRTMLLERIWNFDFDPRTNIVETHISRLRAKLNAGFDDDAILTVRGAGYTIRTD